MATKYRPDDYTVTSVRRKGMEQVQFGIIDTELHSYRVTLDSAGEWSAERLSGVNISNDLALILISVAAIEIIKRVKVVI